MLPLVLKDPPWLKVAVPTRAATLVPVPVPPRVEWAEGAQEAWLGTRRASDSERTDASDERWLDVLLDAIDEGHGYREADVARLGDDALLDFVAEAGTKITLATARYVMARLEAGAVEILVKLAVRLFPNESLLPVFEHAVSTSVAELMLRAHGAQDRMLFDAAKVRARPFSPTNIERWLERFPEEAGLTLLEAWSNDGSPGHPAAQPAGTYLAARGHEAALRRAAQRVGMTQTPAWLHLGPLAALTGDGLDWLPSLIAGGAADVVGPLVVELDRSELAPLMALWTAEGDEGTKGVATTWLAAYPESARAGIATLAEAGQAAANVGLEQVDDPSAASEQSELERFPELIPALPPFWKAGLWPAPRLHTGDALDAEALTHLGTMLRFTPLHPPYAGIEHVRDACESGSLDDFGVALLGAFEAAGAPGTDLWCLYGASLIGDERVLAELLRLVKTWATAARRSEHYERPREIALGRAAIDALAAHRSDVALLHLDAMRRGKSGWQQRAAEKALERVSAGRAIPRARLEDHLVPDFGLDADGSLVLDLGEREVRVVFDEQLLPRLIAEGGKPLRSFPRKRKTDGEAYDDAKRTFTTLRDNVKVLARSQLGMLEHAMCHRRRWDAALFRSKLVEHPLLSHLAPRLVFGAYLAGELRQAFRVAEDRSFADVDDDPFELDPAAKVAIVHPIELEHRERWAALLEDYELLQPFPQVSRRTFHRGEDEVGIALPIAEGARFESKRCFGLTKREWERRPFHELLASGVERKWAEYGEVTDGIVTLFEKSLVGGTAAWLAISPGFDPRRPNEPSEQRLMRVFVDGRLDALDPVAFSELRLDVSYLA